MRKEKVLNIIVIFLILGCLIMIGLIIYDSQSKPKKEEKVNEPVNVEGPYVETPNGKLPSELDLTDRYLKNTIHLFDNTYTDKYFGYYFKVDKIFVKDMDQNVINNIAIQGFANKLLDVGSEINEVCVTKKEVEEYSKKVLYKDVSFIENMDIIYNDTGDFQFKDDKYCGKLLGGKDQIGDNIFHRIVGYSDGSLYLDIYTKYTYCQTIYNEETKKPECIFRSTLNIDTTDNYLGKAEFSLSPSKEMFDKANTYMFRYKKEKDNLYFYSVEKVIK